MRLDDSRKRYPIFVQIGLVGALGLMILLFSVEWRSTGEFNVFLPPPEGPEVVPQSPTQHRAPPPPPQPPPPIPGNDELGEELPEWSPDPAWQEMPPAFMPQAPPELVAPEPEGRSDPFILVEQMPEMIGGHEALQRRVRYPEMARRIGIEGTVFVEFVVDEQGDVSQIQCLRHPGGGTCEAAIDAIRQTRFTPGLQRNQPVRVRMTLPVRFRLN